MDDIDSDSSVVKRRRVRGFRKIAEEGDSSPENRNRNKKYQPAEQSSQESTDKNQKANKKAPKKQSAAKEADNQANKRQTGKTPRRGRSKKQKQQFQQQQEQEYYQPQEDIQKNKKSRAKSTRSKAKASVKNEEAEDDDSHKEYKVNKPKNNDKKAAPKKIEESKRRRTRTKKQQGSPVKQQSQPKPSEYQKDQEEESNKEKPHRVKKYYEMCTDDDAADSIETPQTFDYELENPGRKKGNKAKKNQIKTKNRFFSGVDFCSESADTCDPNMISQTASSDLHFNKYAGLEGCDDGYSGTLELQIESRELQAKPREQLAFVKTIQNMKKMHTILTTDERVESQELQMRARVLPLKQLSQDENEQVEVVVVAPQIISGKGNDLVNKTLFMQKVIKNQGLSRKTNNSLESQPEISEEPQQRVKQEELMPKKKGGVSRQEYFAELQMNMNKNRRIQLPSQVLKSMFNNTSLEDVEEEFQNSKGYSSHTSFPRNSKIDKAGREKQNSQTAAGVRDLKDSQLKNSSVSIATPSQIQVKTQGKISQLKTSGVRRAEKNSIVQKMKMAEKKSNQTIEIGPVKNQAQIIKEESIKKQSAIEAINKTLDQINKKSSRNKAKESKIKQSKKKTKTGKKPKKKRNQVQSYFIEEAEVDSDGPDADDDDEEEDDEQEVLKDLIDDQDVDYNSQNQKIARQKILEAQSHEDEIFVKRFLNGDFLRGNKKRNPIDYMLLDQDSKRRQERRLERKKELEEMYGKEYFQKENDQLKPTHLRSSTLADDALPEQQVEDMPVAEFMIDDNKPQVKEPPIRSITEILKDTGGKERMPNTQGLKAKTQINRSVLGSALRENRKTVNPSVMMRRTSALYEKMKNRLS